MLLTGSRKKAVRSAKPTSAPLSLERPLGPLTRDGRTEAQTEARRGDAGRLAGVVGQAKGRRGAPEDEAAEGILDDGGRRVPFVCIFQDSCSHKRPAAATGHPSQRGNSRPRLGETTDLAVLRSRSATSGLARLRILRNSLVRARMRERR